MKSCNEIKGFNKNGLKNERKLLHYADDVNINTRK